MKSQIPREVVDEMVRLYRKGLSTHVIAQHVGVCQSHTLKLIKERGQPTREMHWRRDDCLDCGKPSSGHTRCEYHTRIRQAELQLDHYDRHRPQIQKRNREYQREYKRRIRSR